MRVVTRRATPSPAGPALLALVLASLLLGVRATAQSEQAAARPDRGAVTGASYSVSDVESVSLTNGNVNLSIPLASLPPVAGGKLSLGVSATYNSKLWNVVRRSESYGGEMDWRPYTVDQVQLSDLGGWGVGGAYRVEIRNARDDTDYAVPPQNGGIPYYDWYQLTNGSFYKLVLHTPDGAERELRPTGYGSYEGTLDQLRGYFGVLPGPSNPIKYYSFDGTFLTAVVKSTSDWTLLMPDGTQVTQSPDGVQRLRDTNGNAVKIFSDAAGTHYQDEHTGREIKVTHDPAANGGQGQSLVWYQTAGGGWTTITINWGWTRVQGRVYKVNDWSISGGETGGGFVCRRDELLQPTDVRVIREIVYPQTEPSQPGRRFSFDYNSDATEAVTVTDFLPGCGMAYETRALTSSKGLGELSRMVTPAGAEVRYAYTLDPVGGGRLSEADDFARGAITEKQVEHDGTTDIWDYDISDVGWGGSVTNPDGTRASETNYPHSPGMGFSVGKAGLVYRSESAGVRVERRWGDLLFDGGNSHSPAGSTNFNPVVTAEYTTLLEPDASGTPVPVKMSAKTYQRDFNGNVTEVREYDWFAPIPASGRDAQGVPTGVPAGAKLLRTTTTSYHNSPGTDASSALVYARRSVAAGTPSFINAAKESTAGNSRTRLAYDGQGYESAPTLGNVTQVSRLDDKGDSVPGNDTWVTTSTAYGAYGNPSSTTDPNGNVTEYFYEDATHALPTRVVVDPLNETEVQTTQTAYDYWTGLVKSTTDPNGQVSEVSYVNQLTGLADPFGRPGVVTGPAVEVGGTLQRRKVFTFYEEANQSRGPRVRVESDLNAEGDRLLKRQTTSDRLGRVILAEQSEDGSSYTISSRTVYAQMGRVTLRSSATRSGSPTDSWARVTRDDAGRVVEAATFGGAAQPSATLAASAIPNWTGSVKTAYWADETTVTDQAGKSRKSASDALGRLVRVVEAPGVQGYGFATDYDYDALGNLRKVEQGGQLRFFMYDSLSRLIRAKNPEQGAFAADVDFPALTDTSSGTSNSQWSTGYLYDPAGNLTKRKDARGVVTAYGYDGLNRNISVVYSGETGTPTPNVTRSYDGAILGKGRPWKSESTQTGLTTVEEYDAAGRPLGQNQKFWAGGAWGAAYPVSYTYDLAGNIKTQTYPSGHSVSYDYDGAGRLNGFTGNLGDGAPRTYSAGIAYDASGRVRQEQFGTQTPVYNKRLYNSRGQLAEVRVSTHSLFEQGHQTDWNRGALINHYSNAAGAWGATGGGADNNGNLLRQEVYVPNDDQMSGHYNAVQHYGYDALNRLTSVEEKLGNATTQFTQAYQYDRWGNRTILQAGTSNAPAPAYTASAATNRLAPPAGYAMTYDPAGNLTHDNYRGGQGGGGAMTYDAENRMTSAQFLAGQTQTALYAYDADGRRVKSKAGAAAEVWQVYGAGGELLAEYALNASRLRPIKEYGYRSGELLVTAEAPARFNVALASNGATATAQGYTADGVYPGLHFRPSYANDGRRYATPQGDGYWRKQGLATWLDVDFGGQMTIDEVDVYTLPDHPAYTTQADPTAAQTFTQYGATSFEVLYWTGAAWAAVPGGSVTGNNLVWRKVTFPAVTTDKIRVVVNSSPDGVARVTEVEAWGAAGPPQRVNAALASQGGQATASSTTPDTEFPGLTFPVSSVNNGDRKGLNWEHGGGWRDGTNNTYPDWVEVAFAGAKTIDEIDVFTVQDNLSNPSEPTEAMTFAQYGATGYNVRYWSGSQWVTLPGASVSGNNKVWRKFTFPAVTTSKVRVEITGALAGRSRLVEVEAWGTQAGSTAADVRWLVTDQLGTPRMTIDQAGSLAGVKRHDYLPFGEELFAGTGGRTPARGYGADDYVRQKFTGYERDTETGLDFAQARYYSSSQGRFTSPDPLLSSGRVALPQSWNRYSYVLNSPTRLTDPTGLIDSPGQGQQKETPKPPPPPQLDFKQLPLICTFGEHEDGGATVAAGAEKFTVAMPTAAAKILEGVYANSFSAYFPEAARNAVETRTGTVEPGDQSVQREQVESAEINATLSDKSSAGTKVGVTNSNNTTQNFSTLPRLEGEIQTRTSVLTYNAKAISDLAKIEVAVRHQGVTIKVPIGQGPATTLVMHAAGLGQHNAKEVAKNALKTVP